MTRKLLALSALALLSPSLRSQVATPTRLHFQARLSDAGGAPLAGPLSLTVRIYDVAIGGSSLWSETQSVTALAGVVNVDLGAMTPIPDAAFAGAPRFFAVQVNADPEMLPRREIQSTPYARRAASSAGVEPGAVVAANVIGSLQILDGSVAGADLANGAVTAGKIAPGAVGNAELAMNCVTSDRIQNGSVGTADLADGAVTAPKLAVGALTGASIADGSIGTADLASGAVTNAKIGLLAVGSTNIAAGAVDTVRIADNAVTNAKLAGGAVDTPQIANGAITSAKILNGAVGVNEFEFPLVPSGSNAAIRIEKGAGGGDAFQSFITPSGAGGVGVLGETAGSGGAGVRGRATSATGQPTGVEGFSENGYGVYGHTGSGIYGVIGIHEGTGSLMTGVKGIAEDYGVWGLATSASGYGVFSDGDFGGTGAKFFIQPHPTDPSREIRFIALEGNEAGTYFRGTAKIAGGVAVIEVPAEFRLVSEAHDLTVQLTPSAPKADLWVEAKSLDRVVVRGERDVEFDYQVNGVRRGYAGHVPTRENVAFVPRYRGVPFATQHPEAFRKILVESGILNADGTPNEATAARMGWKLVDPSTDPTRPEFKRD